MPDNIREIKKLVIELPFTDLERLADWCEDLIAKRRYAALSDATDGIDPKKVLQEFRKSLGKPNVWRTVTPGDAATYMQMFYEETRVRGCRFEDEADMLLVEWGAVNRSEYALAYTRQLMPPNPNGGADVWQLRLELRFPMTEQLRKIKDGSRWFESLKQTEKYNKLTLAQRPFSILADTEPSKAFLTYANAE
jgi:hypothetical protein